MPRYLVECMVTELCVDADTAEQAEIRAWESLRREDFLAEEIEPEAHQEARNG